MPCFIIVVILKRITRLEEEGIRVVAWSSEPGVTARYRLRGVSTPEGDIPLVEEFELAGVLDLGFDLAVG